MRLAGLALILLSALILFDRGVRFTNNRRAFAHVSDRADASPKTLSDVTPEASPHIDDVVDRVLV